MDDGYYREAYSEVSIRHADCPRCQARFGVIDYEPGVKVVCPECGHDIAKPYVRPEDDPEVVRVTRGDVSRET